MKKNIKIMCGKGSLLGDIIMFLPSLTILKKLHPDCSITFPIAKKCQQIVPLLLTHPLIDSIYITEEYEGLNNKDIEWIEKQKFDLLFNPFTPSPSQSDWYNYRNCIEQTLLMTSKTFLIEYEKLKEKDKYPKLYIQSTEKQQNAIYIWPFAGYGKSPHRNPSPDYWNRLIKELINKYTIYHCGSDNEPVLIEHENYHKITSLPFAEQIVRSLAGKLIIGTDSGSLWVTAACVFGPPQISLITNHNTNHNSNKLALAPIGRRCHNLYADNGCDNILQKDVLDLIIKLI